jgi:hypothetical protein
VSDLDDLRLDRSGEPPLAPETGFSWGRIAIAVVIAVGIIVVGYVWWRRSAPAATTPTAAGSKAPAQAVAAPPPVAGEAIELPPLDQSDALVRDLVSRLSSNPRVAQWLTTPQLIRNFAVVVANIADGRTPIKNLQRMRPNGNFVAATDAAGSYIDPASYRRFDDYAAAVAGLDPDGTARLYETLKPRIVEAYRELGYPDGDFDGALRRAVVLILETPVVEGRIGVTGTPASYNFTDDRLQSLKPAQRQLLRMGPRNEQLVQEKLRELAPLLGMAPETLPPARVIREGQSG